MTALPHIASARVVQNRAGYYWSANDVHARPQTVLARAFTAVHDRMTSDGVDMRTAAYVHALSRLSEAIKSQGTRQYFAGGDQQDANLPVDASANQET